MEQLNMFGDSPYPRSRIQICVNPECPVGEYPIDLAEYAFGTQKYCKPCRSTLRHSMDAVYRSVQSREFGHAVRKWAGYDGSTVLAFRSYLAHEQWDLKVLASQIRESIGNPCPGCKRPYEIRGEQPHLIQGVKDAHIDVIEPLLRPGKNNLQIICVTCNTSKKDKTYAEWVGTQNMYEYHAHAEVAARKVA